MEPMVGKTLNLFKKNDSRDESESKFNNFAALIQKLWNNQTRISPHQRLSSNT
jgi:hypothetical protein